MAPDLGGRSRIRTWVGVSRRIYSPLPLALVLSSRVSWFNKALVRAVGLLQWPQDGVLKLLRAICGWTADPDTHYWRNHKRPWPMARTCHR
jgi:hypothetical protein